MVAWKRRTLLTASGLLVAGCSTADLERTDDHRRTTRPAQNWATAGYDVANTGHVPAASPVREHTEDWRFRVDNRADILANPVVVDGAVYAGSGQTIYSLSLEDGSSRWATETEYDTGFLSVTVADGTLLVSGLARDGGALLALDSGTGTVEWRRPLPVKTAPTVVDDRVYIGTADAERGLAAVDVSSGDEVWSVPFDGDRTVSALRSAPAVQEDTVYTTTRGETGDTSSTVLQAVGTDGTRQWEVTVPGETNAAPAVDDSTVYLATSEGTVHAVGNATGDERWSTAVSGAVYSSPAVDEDHLYLGTFDGELSAIDKKRGTKTWVTEASVLYTDPGVTDETLYVGGETVQARNKEDGTGRWSYDMFSGGHTEFTSPAVIDGTVLVGVCAKEQRHQANYDNFVLKFGGGSDTPPGRLPDRGDGPPEQAFTRTRA